MDTAQFPPAESPMGPPQRPSGPQPVSNRSIIKSAPTFDNFMRLAYKLNPNQDVMQDADKAVCKTVRDHLLAIELQQWRQIEILRLHLDGDNIGYILSTRKLCVATQSAINEKQHTALDQYRDKTFQTFEDFVRNIHRHPCTNERRCQLSPEVKATLRSITRDEWSELCGYFSRSNGQDPRELSWASYLITTLENAIAVCRRQKHLKPSETCNIKTVVRKTSHVAEPRLLKFLSAADDIPRPDDYPPPAELRERLLRVSLNDFEFTSMHQFKGTCLADAIEHWTHELTKAVYNGLNLRQINLMQSIDHFCAHFLGDKWWGPRAQSHPSPEVEASSSVDTRRDSAFSPTLRGSTEKHPIVIE
ncbi:hypothetical protein JCM3766R1_006061 [Sporobolomyces carnicolor]